MADTSFVDEVTHVIAAWLNDVNKAVYRAIGSGGVAPETPAQVRTALGLPNSTPPTGASLIGLHTSITTVKNVQQYTDALFSSTGAGLVGFQPVGDLSGGTIQGGLAELDSEKASLLHSNSWINKGTHGGTPTPQIDGEQFLDYTSPALTTTVGGRDWGGWTSFIRNAPGSVSNDNITALTGHGYWDSTVHISAGGVWGVVTEAWSNPEGYSTLIGGELAVISASSTMDNPSVGLDLVFKNRPDTHEQTDTGANADSLYNRKSMALFISSQHRPRTDGWKDSGSGWSTAIKVGDPGDGAGLDWEGGSKYPRSEVHKAYTTVLDLTDCLNDLAGGWPWHSLYRNGHTYFGMRFNGSLTGQLEVHNVVVKNGGTGYVFQDIGIIDGGGGNGGSARYEVYETDAGTGAVKTVRLVTGGFGYSAGPNQTTSKITGNGTGLTLDITVGVGLLYGAMVGVATGGTGHHIGDTFYLEGGTPGYLKPLFMIKEINLTTGAALRVEMVVHDNFAVSSRDFTIGRGFTTGAKAVTYINAPAGTGLTLDVAATHDDVIIGGEKWEYWRMQNPGNPYGTGYRLGYVDASFPGRGMTIDTAQATYTFPVDHPM